MISRLERTRLWLSYQRYALVLLVGVPAAVAALAWWRPGAWWLWGPAALLAVKPVLFGVEVWRKWPRKLRATLVGLRRIAAGRFRPESVRAYCGDPCFRVVARELLGRAGHAGAERRALVKRLRAELAAADRVFVLVQPDGVKVVLGEEMT